MSSAIIVFTAESQSEIVENGGTQSWAVDRKRAAKQGYLVCVRNAHNSLTDGNEPHGSAFMIGKVRGVVAAPSPKRPNEIGRWMIAISEYAEIEIPNVWGGWRNPVRYSTLEMLGIDPARCGFRSVSQ